MLWNEHSQSGQEWIDESQEWIDGMNLIFCMLVQIQEN